MLIFPSVSSGETSRENKIPLAMGGCHFGDQNGHKLHHLKVVINITSPRSVTNVNVTQNAIFKVIKDDAFANFMASMQMTNAILNDKNWNF